MNVKEVILEQVDVFLASDYGPTPDFFGLTSQQFRGVFEANLYVEDSSGGAPEIYLFLPSNDSGGICNPVFDNRDPFAWKCSVKRNQFGAKRVYVGCESNTPSCLFHRTITDIILSAMEKISKESEDTQNVA